MQTNRNPNPYPPAPQAPPRPPAPSGPNETSRGYAVAGVVVALIATIFALVPLWDKVSVFGVVGLALTVIAACSLASDRGRTPVWIGTVAVAGTLSVASILVVALT